MAVDTIPATGQRLELVADAETRTRLARLAGILDVIELKAEFLIHKRAGDRVEATGRLHGRVRQSCVVTLEPVELPVDEPIEVAFAEAIAAGGAPAEPSVAAGQADDGEAPDAPEPIVNGRIDLGAVAAEFLVLGIDPYPRKPGAVFAPHASVQDPSDHPFAALGALKKDKTPGAGSSGQG